MIYLNSIGCYLTENKISNISRADQFSVDENFILQKIGMATLRVKKPEQDTSDLCVRAYLALKEKADFHDQDIDCLIVCTQNPDSYGLPHVSALVHEKLALNNTCAVFDISLGCSGYVYGLSIIQSFMLANDFKKGIFITADPYSKIVDENDKNTALLFGDAATATLLSHNDYNSWGIGRFLFGSDGSKHRSIYVDNHSKKLVMHGREILNFAAKIIPYHIQQTLRKNNLLMNQVDNFIFHQGSKFIVDTIREMLCLEEEKVPFSAKYYGNTVSSSIPMILSDISSENKTILICGFGVGLSWGSCILNRM
ncbi:MAG: 3-oxoacyl-ACP synthase [Legionellales bacterium RIFCSPHIGHO2_12_FULL_37_14]|nr:MAG: 3-oxoacyl-ACP synthase [Legionellales bacterium RIFCSPHIGHO2_12_FULL_37_14]